MRTRVKAEELFNNMLASRKKPVTTRDMAKNTVIRTLSLPIKLAEKADAIAKKLYGRRGFSKYIAAFITEDKR